MPSRQKKTTLRDNLESIALAVVAVLILRQLVVEAFKIPTGSMAPTLVGVHKEVRCPRCGYVFAIGKDNTRSSGEVTCPNCRREWKGASRYYHGQRCTGKLQFRWPGWLWNEAYSPRCGASVTGSDAANRVLRGGSRIFVNKFIYWFRKPDRWEVIVFRYPYVDVRCPECGWDEEVRVGEKVECNSCDTSPDSLDDLQCPVCGEEKLQISRKNYIKRLVGMPGETVTIQNGDVYVDGHLAPKPQSVQNRIWLPVYDSRYTSQEDGESPWNFGRTAGLWSDGKARGSLVLDARDRAGRTMATYGPVITDSYGYNGGPSLPLEQDTPGLPGDLRISARVRPLEASDNAAVVLRIVEDTRVLSLTIPVETGAMAVLEEDGRIVKQAAVDPLQVGELTTVTLQNWDDRVACIVGGETLMTWTYNGDPTPRVERQKVGMGGRGARIEFRRCRIKRDIYYLKRGNGERYRLAEGEYFMLGDNSPQSSDSRYWPDPAVPAQNIIGRAFLEFWPFHRGRLLSFGAGTPEPTAGGG
jgi:signal peptidase I